MRECRLGDLGEDCLYKTKHEEKNSVFMLKASSKNVGGLKCEFLCSKYETAGNFFL